MTRYLTITSEMLIDLGSSSKMIAERDFLLMLREEGRRAAGEFLDEHLDDIGKRSTADLDVLLSEC